MSEELIKGRICKGNSRVVRCLTGGRPCLQTERLPPSVDRNYPPLQEQGRRPIPAPMIPSLSNHADTIASYDEAGIQDKTTAVKDFIHSATLTAGSDC